MKKVYSLIACAFITSTCAASSPMVVNITAEGNFWDPMRNIDVKVPIYATVMSEHDFRILAGTRSNNASVFLGFGAGEEIIAALKKFDNWASKAKELELEASKDLIDFPHHVEGIDEGTIPELRFIFSASKKGTESHVELEMHDFDSSRVIVIRLEREQLPKLIKVFEELPKTFEKYRGEQDKTKQLN